MIFNSIAKRFGTRSTQCVSWCWGDKFPFYYVAEYPRSGGNWLCGMLSDYTGVPFPVSSVLPIGFKSIHHVHWGYSKRLSRVIHLVRDGRDICISFFFYMHRKYSSEPKLLPRRWRKFFSGFEPGSKDSVIASLPEFMELWCKVPWGCRIAWPDFVLQWRDKEPNVVLVRYEDLLDDCEGTLAQVIPKVFEMELNQTKLKETVRRFSFEALSGRKQGEEDTTAFIRKGIAGDWKNYFTKDLGQQFDDLAGQGLREYGYESDSDWPQRLT